MHTQESAPAGSGRPAPPRKARRAYPAQALQQARDLAAVGRVDDAIALAEQTWLTSGSRFPASFGLILDLIQKSSGRQAAQQRARSELARAGLSRRARGLIEARLALLCLPVATVGEWLKRPTTAGEQEAVQLAEAGLRDAGSIPATHAPMALVYAYQGDLELAMQHANAALRGAKLDDPRWTPYVSLAQVVFGMVAAARGDTEPAAAFLTLARKIQPDSEWLGALRRSLPAGQIEKPYGRGSSSTSNAHASQSGPSKPTNEHTHPRVTTPTAADDVEPEVEASQRPSREHDFWYWRMYYGFLLMGPLALTAVLLPGDRATSAYGGGAVVLIGFALWTLLRRRVARLRTLHAWLGFALSAICLAIAFAIPHHK
jgi:hypothetical protein